MCTCKVPRMIMCSNGSGTLKLRHVKQSVLESKFKTETNTLVFFLALGLVLFEFGELSRENSKTYALDGG